MQKAQLESLLAGVHKTPTQAYAQGAPFVEAMRHGTMSVEIYAPKGVDLQRPHAQDELYIIQSGQGVFLCGDVTTPFSTGTVLFVPAGKDHRFVEFSEDFLTWVVFWGPEGGERP